MHLAKINPTGIDTLAAQIQTIASTTLLQLRLAQENVTGRAFAIRCQVATENAAHATLVRSRWPEARVVMMFALCALRIAVAQITVRSFDCPLVNPDEKSDSLTDALPLTGANSILTEMLVP